MAKGRTRQEGAYRTREGTLASGAPYKSTRAKFMSGHIAYSTASTTDGKIERSSGKLAGKKRELLQTFDGKEVKGCTARQRFATKAPNSLARRGAKAANKILGRRQ